MSLRIPIIPVIKVPHMRSWSNSSRYYIISISPIQCHLVGGFNYLEKYEFVNGKDYPIYSGKLNMFETSNRSFFHGLIPLNPFIVWWYPKHHSVASEKSVWAEQGQQQKSSNAYQVHPTRCFISYQTNKSSGKKLNMSQIGWLKKPFGDDSPHPIQNNIDPVRSQPRIQRWPPPVRLKGISYKLVLLVFWYRIIAHFFCWS